MTAATCRPLMTLASISEREQTPDRFAELLECSADLLVETGRQTAAITQRRRSDQPREREAIERLVAPRVIGRKPRTGAGGPGWRGDLMSVRPRPDRSEKSCS
jgi:hypothetical protein